MQRVDVDVDGIILKTREFYLSTYLNTNLNPVQEPGVFVCDLENLVGIPLSAGNLCDKLRRPGNHPGMRERELLTRFERERLARQGGGSHVRSVRLQYDAKRAGLSEVSDDGRGIFIRIISYDACFEFAGSRSRSDDG